MFRSADGTSPVARRLVDPTLPVRIMGIVNVTPDSFSDGGRFLDPEAAVRHGLELARQGAHLLDVGGESTRPGSEGVDAAEELRRVLPVVSGLAAACGLPISIDTSKASVAEAALDAGATMVNDVGAGRLDPGMLPLVAARGCAYVAMHMRGRPRDMQAAPQYDDVVEEVVRELGERVEACVAAGVDTARLTVDPGIGFGKTLEHNLELLRRLEELGVLGLPVLVGPSRKAFVGTLTERSEPAERTFGTAAAVAACVLGGADVVRVHDVGAMRDVVRVSHAIATRGARGTQP